jgi:hypothetical protein
MRARFFLTLAALVGAVAVRLPAADDKARLDPPADKKSAVDDAAAITMALRHFSEQKVLWAFTGRESRKSILINRESAGPSPLYLSDAQLRADLANEKWSVPKDLAEGLRQRNAKTVLLDDLKFGSAVLVGDFKDGPPVLDGAGAPKKYAAAKAYADVWLPVYSKDGRTAVVRFWFGPTAHGATATYLLSKKDGTWTVTKWGFAYYA